MSASVYPNGYFSWSDRRDEVDIDYAADPNSLAAEAVAIEKTLGLNPQIQKNPNLGPPIEFVNVDQRLDYITAMSQLPVCQLSCPSFEVASLQGPATNYGVFNRYTVADYDPFGMFNGADITCQISGFYLINITQFWQWWSTGYHCHHFWIDDTWKCSDRWDWDFVGNEIGGYWRGGPDFDFARPGHTQTWWMGIVNQGQRFRVVSENGTAFTPAITTNMEFKAALLRRTPPPVGRLPAPVIPLSTTSSPTVTRFFSPGFCTATIISGVVTVEWGVVIEPIIAESYTVAVYYANYPNGLAFLTEIPAPGGDPSSVQAIISTLTPGNSYVAHVYADISDG